TPAASGRSARISHHAVATAAATRAPGCPTITPNAAGKTPTHSSRCAVRAKPSPGARRYQVHSKAAISSALQMTRAEVTGSDVSGVTSHAKGGGDMNGWTLNSEPRPRIAGGC